MKLLAFMVVWLGILGVGILLGMWGRRLDSKQGFGRIEPPKPWPRVPDPNQDE